MTIALLIAPVVVYLLALFVVPVGYVLLLSVTDPRLSLENYRRLFTVPLYADVMLHTVEVAGIVTASCLLLGYPLAYVMARRKILLGNRGPISALYAFAGWGRPPQLLFTSFASALGMIHILLPYMVFALYGVMRRIDPSYLRAAASLGAGPSRAFRHVFLPLSLPGVVNGCVLVFTVCLGFYITPILFGLGLRRGDRRRAAGDDARPPCAVRPLCRSRPAVGLALMRHLALVMAALVAIFLVAPLAIIVPMSFSTAVSFAFPPPGYWLGYYTRYFHSGAWLDATANSFVIALGSMTLTLAVSLPAAFGYVRYRFPGRKAVNLFVMLPLIVTGVIVAHSALSVPIAFLVISAALKGFDRNLERAAYSAGAGPLRTFLWVTLPVLRPGLLIAALFAFLHSFNEAVVAIFIAGRDASTLPKKMFESIRLESDPVIAVVSTLLTAAVLGGVLISLCVRHRSAHAA